MKLNILHIALFPSIKTQEKNICNTWSETRKNKFHIVWLVHPPPCDIHTPLGLPLFLPPLLAPVPPAHTEAPTSSRGHRTLAGVTPLPRETPQYPSPWFPGQTHLLHVPTPAGTAGWHSVNGPLARHRPYISIQEIENEVCGLTEKKKKKNPQTKPKGEKKHLMWIMWRLVFCFLIQGSQAAKQKQNILGSLSLFLQTWDHPLTA